MVATYTTNARLTKQGTGDNPNTWGEVLNEQVIELVEDMAVSVAPIDVTGTSNVTLTTANGSPDQARNAVLELTGALGADIELIIPSVNWKYFIRGAWTGDFTVTVRISGSSTSVPLSTGDTKIIYANGVDVYDMVDVDLTGLLTSANNLSDVADVPTSRTNLGLGDVATQNLTDVLQAVYPVGSLYLNAAVATNPATLLGFGTWVAEGEGRVLVGVGTGTDANSEMRSFTLGETDGEYDHTLTIAEMPAHTHDRDYRANTGGGIHTFPSRSGVSGNQNFPTESTGGGESHNNVQPYIAVHIWRRTA